MGFEGEFASYEPLRRLLDSEKVKALHARLKVRQLDDEAEGFKGKLITNEELLQSPLQPNLILAIDGSYLASKAENGFPGAEIGYVTVSSVLIDLKRVNELEVNEFISPKKFRETEKASTIESAFPGCNVILDNEKNAKASLRRSLFEELKSNVIFTEGESLLDTYEALLKIKLANESEQRPDSPLDDVDAKMQYGYGEYTCDISGESLFSTDAMRLHELMNPSGTNGEMFGQIMSTLEKLWLVHILRAFEKKNWLPTLRNVAFIMDGPLAVFSTSSWLTKAIMVELNRINELQKSINKQDLLIIGIEKSGNFFNHFLEIDTTKDGVTDSFPKQTAQLLDDSYIKRNIIFSDSEKPYGLDTYFGRKIFYKTKSGHKLVASIAFLRNFENAAEHKKFLKSCSPDLYPRLGDVLNLLDSIASNRYPNSVSPLVSAHAEAAIPLNLGKRIFEDIAREIREKSTVS